MKNGKRIVGLLLICISIAGIIGWEHWGKELFLYDQVLVLRENVPKGTIITEEMLDVEVMEFDEPCFEFSERKQIIGMQAAGFIHKGTPLFATNFQEPDLEPNSEKNRYEMCLPVEWIASKPSTLSRGDEVFLFFGKRLLTEADVAEVTKDGAVEIIVGKAEAASICQVMVDGGRLALVRR